MFKFNSKLDSNYSKTTEGTRIRVNGFHLIICTAQGRELRGICKTEWYVKNIFTCPFF